MISITHKFIYIDFYNTQIFYNDFYNPQIYLQWFL